MKKLIPLSVLALLVSACSSIDTSSEKVSFSSTPCGADVYVNGNLVGQTPMVTELRGTNSYSVQLVKEGYTPATVDIASERPTDKVKFGLLVDTGYYKSLTPNPVTAELSPSFLPTSKTAATFADMTANIVKVDEMKASGAISEKEYAYLLGKITEFYSK